MVINENSRLYREVKSYDTFIIFGTGDQGGCECRFWRKKQIEPLCFLVSGELDYPEILMNLPVKRFDEISDKLKENALILIGRPETKNKESFELLKKAGFNNVLPGAFQWKFGIDKEMVEEIEQTYSPVKYIENRYKKEQGATDDGMMIYACISEIHYHKTIDEWKSDRIKYVQGGAKIAKTRICELGDDTGDNISVKNEQYNELSVGYWAYKNDDIHDIIGLYHYSRGLDINLNIVRELFNEADAVLPLPHYFNWGVDSFTSYEEQVYLKRAIEKVFPDYLDDFNTFFNGNLFCESNLIIAKREVFCELYDWMFCLFEEIERFLDEENLWTPRLTAYIGEHMFNIFFIHNKEKYKIAMAPIKSLA